MRSTRTKRAGESPLASEQVREARGREIDVSGQGVDGQTRIEVLFDAGNGVGDSRVHARLLLKAIARLS
jgi:hypothetical protein